MITFCTPTCLLQDYLYMLLPLVKLNGNFILPENTANHRRASSGITCPPPNNWLIKPRSHVELYLSCSGVCHFFVQADVQIVARLIGQEETNGNCLPSRCQTNVDLQLGLEDAQFPQATPVAHHHAPHRFFDLKTHEKNFPHLGGHIHCFVTPPSHGCTVLLKG